jgi:glutathione synthase/RimK-type ligase-like ATP-grasp enzyme
LVAHEPALAARLVEGHRAAVADGEVEGLRAAVLEVLDRVGGPLVEGYRVGGLGGRADVLLVTCSALPDGEDGGDLLVAELAARGLVARWAAWDDPTVDWSAARAVAVRSTWDYESRREEFLAWAGSVGPGLLNGADVLVWNTDKAYLLDLAEAGLPVVPTVLAKTPDEASAAAARFGTAVCKPTVGAGGRGLVVLDGCGEPAGAGPWLVQPVVESVHAEGELSVFVLGGRAVAEVRKVAGGDDVRVHEEYGGRSAAVPLADEHAALAVRAVHVAEELLDGDLSYARVDLMRLADGTLAVGELEVTEPGFYLDLVPQVAADFAAMLADRLG